MLVLLIALASVVFTTAYIQWRSFDQQQHLRQHSQEEDRKSWESNPDKHPHRMAHFGAFAFRVQHPLSIIETGLETYMGNVVYLEAHKQNTANFSEASLSTGLVRFGDLSVGMLTYLVLPLFIFFVGHDAVTREREQSTLKLIYIQGAELREIVLGKSLGLFAGALLFSLPSLIALLSVSLVYSPAEGDVLSRALLIVGAYLIFLAVISLWTVFVSSWSRSSSQSLLTLLGLWLLLFIVLPKVAQSVGSAVYPAPSKLLFRKAIEEEVAAFGDPHNAQDPHFDKLKDSLKQAYQVSDIKDLPFNFGGYLAALGEKNSSAVYARHQKALMQTYRQQASLSAYLSLINPYLAIKQVSMGLSGTDFETYDNYLLQAETYRFALATHMADLQTKYVNPKNVSGGTEGKKNAVSREEFLRFPPFEYHYYPLGRVLADQRLALTSLGVMLILSLALAFQARKFFTI